MRLWCILTFIFHYFDIYFSQLAWYSMASGGILRIFGCPGLYRGNDDDGLVETLFAYEVYSVVPAVDRMFFAAGGEKHSAERPLFRRSASLEVRQ